MPDDVTQTPEPGPAPVPLIDRRPPRPTDRAWTDEAVRRLRADANRSADTHLIRLDLPDGWDVDLYLKDESTHPTGSLKHRLARSLFLYALCNGYVHEGTTIIEASSGSTAVSEAHFARMLGLPFVAVMHRDTSLEKIHLIEQEGGSCHLVDDPSAVYDVSRQLAQEYGGYFIDQFTYAERATDWRGNNNIAESIISQLAAEPHPEPAWIVCGVGTGGTSATIGRYLRYRALATQLCVAEPAGSAFVHAWRSRDRSDRCSRPTVIEGIGRPQVEPGWVFETVDEVIEVPDAASIAAMQLLKEHLGRAYGGSSGTNLVACLELACRMREQGQQGSIVTLLCDPGERYDQTLYCPDWLARNGLDPTLATDAMRRTLATGRWQPLPE